MSPTLCSSSILPYLFLKWLLGPGGFAPSPWGPRGKIMVVMELYLFELYLGDFAPGPQALQEKTAALWPDRKLAHQNRP